MVSRVTTAKGAAWHSTEPGLFELPDRYRELQDEARELASAVGGVRRRGRRVRIRASGDARPLASSGLAAVTVPRGFGGRFTGVDSLAVTVVREGLAGVSAHLDSLFAMQGIGSYPVTAGGSEPCASGGCPRWPRARRSARWR